LGGETFAQTSVPMLRASGLIPSLLILSTVTAQQYTISTVVGTGQLGSSGNDGPALAASLSYPRGMAFTVDGMLYFAQAGDHVLRVFDTNTGLVHHVAGTGVLGYNGDGGPAAEAGLAAPYDVAVDPEGNVYISEADAYRIRKVNGVDATIGTFAGTLSPGNTTEVPATQAAMNGPRGITFTEDGDLLIALIGNECIRYVDADSSYLHAFAGSGNPGSTGFSGDGGPALNAQFFAPYGVKVAPNGNVYIADLNNRRIRMVDVTTGIITTVAGNGLDAFDGDGIPATEAAIGRPEFLAFDADGNLFFTNAEQSRIRRVDATTGLISTAAGSGVAGYSGDGGPASAASINFPAGMVVDPDGRIYFADSYNQRIRMLTPVDDTSVSESRTHTTVTAYPSPATEVLYVRSTSTGLVELVDLQGRVAQRTWLNTGAARLSLSDVAPGLYVLRMEGATPVQVVVQ
jgi:hypothetical protein